MSKSSTIRIVNRSAVLLALLLTATVTAPAARAELPPIGLPDLVQQLLPSVVNITSRSLVPIATGAMNAAGTPQPKEGVSPDQRAKTSVGSGFVIDPDGLIVTNNHVIEGAFDVSVTFQDGAVAHATVLATTKIGDIALLKVNVANKLPILKFGDSTVMRVGEPVIAIGNPLGFGGSVSTGIVSALNRDIMVTPFDDFIQTDASLNHGNSGGPLLNVQGEVIGVNTALYNPTADGGSIGLGFAIPAYCVQFVIGQLREFGVVRAGEIGLKVQDVTTDIAHAAGLPPTSRTSNILPGSAGWGVIVTNVLPNGPAKRAGMQDGDIITKLDGEAIGDVRAMARMVAVHKLNEATTLSLWRNGGPATAAPIVHEWLTGEKTDRAALANTKSTREERPDLGLKLASLTDEARSSRELPLDQPGVLVVGVMPDSIAGDRGLAEGDVIVKVMNDIVKQPQDVLSGLQAMVDDHRTMVLVLVHGSTGMRWVPLPLNRTIVAATKATATDKPAP